MTVTKPVRFVLQILTLIFVVMGAFRIQETADWFGGIFYIVLAALFWWTSRRPTAK